MRHRRFYLTVQQRRLIFSLCCALPIILILLLLVDARLRPALYDIATLEAEAAAVKAINSAVENELAAKNISYADIIEIKYNSSGNVTSLSSDIIKMNRLKAGVTNAALESINSTERAAVSVPLGSATGLALFSGCGPEIEVDLAYSGSLSSDFENLFVQAGINQTEHRVMLNLTADVIIVLDGRRVSSTLSTSVCVAQTVIIGTVPNFVAG